MANINIKSYNETLGDLVRKIKANTSVNDIHDGSVFLTILEAIASNDFENGVSILNTLELLNIDTIANNDLDAYGSNLGLDRITAVKSSGFVIISDSAITKRSTTLYPIKPAPIAGTTTLYVNDATGWNATGFLYIGRDTQNFEGPIAYNSITDNSTFFTIELASSLQNDHLISEEVVDGQGTSNRLISSGTRIKIPSNNLSPEIGYTILRDAVIPAGEDKIEDVLVVADIAGSLSNAGINTITTFDNPPFPSANITNTNAFTDGRDIETDIEFRDRIKSYTNTLARGTVDSILSAIIGVSDSDDGKQVASAVITEPTKVGDPSLVYLDDGSGFEPSYQGQSVDKLLNNAGGSEEFLQLSNFPLPRPQIVNIAEAPYELIDGMQFRVLVDGVEESVTFLSEDFDSISSAQLYEISIAINDKASSFRCRLTEESTRLLIYPVEHNVETIQIAEGGNSNANDILKFPVNEFSYIKLYKGSELLKEKETSASLITVDFALWNIISAGNLIISVDGTPAQDQSFDVSDFSGSSFSALTVEDYAEAFNNKFAGITATTTTTNKLVMTSNKEGAESELNILGGSYFDKMFSGQAVSASGQNSDFILNRQNGNIQLLTDIESGDTISAGLEDTKGSLISSAASTSGTFSISTDASSRAAEMIIVADAERVYTRIINLPINSSISISDVGSGVMRIMASVSAAFKGIQPNDYVYIANRGDIDGLGVGSWLDVKNCGLYKVMSKGYHTSAGVDTYIDVLNDDIIAGGPYLVQDSSDMQGFFSDEYPQLWKGSFTATPAAAPIQDVVDSINNNIKGVIASIYRTNFVKITSSTEDGGSIAIPISIGNASLVFSTGNNDEEGSQSHIANKTPDKSIVTIFKRTESVTDDVWLDRFTYTDVKGSLTSNSEPGVVYGEELEDTVGDIGDKSNYNDLINIITGSNKGQLKVIQRIPDANNVQTRKDTPTTLMDYIVDDEYQIVKSMSISAEDNMVIILDDDSIAKTVDLSFTRTGRVNSGSQSATFIPTSTEFSADDSDNEPGVDFGTLSVWGKLDTQTNTDFRDYLVWFMARNWYASNGANSSDGAMMLRANQFGPSGEKLRFSIGYPVLNNTSNQVSHSNSPDYTTVSYTFGSGTNRVISVEAGDQVTVSAIGAPIDKKFRLKFLGGLTDFSTVVAGDILSVRSDSGFSVANSGAFRIDAVNIVNNELDIYNVNGTITVVGNPSTKTVDCIAGATLDGKYFILYTPTQSIKFWFNLTGVTVEPAFGTTDVSHEVDDVTSIMTDIQVATYLVSHISGVLGGAAFTANNGGGISATITVECIDNGVVTTGDAATSGFTVTETIPGVSDTYETINVPSSLSVFPLINVSIDDIVSKINESDVVNAVTLRSGNIERATHEEVTSVSYEHDPDYTSGKNEYVGFFDAQNWVLGFDNTNPNFTFKVPFLLPSAALIINPVTPIYKMDTVPNYDSADIGELFKLVPLTLNNLKHQFSHKALSQLEIISDIDYSDANSKVQIKSELLGSQGSIEIVGGRANNVDYSLIGDSQVESDLLGNNHLSAKIPAFPDALNIGDFVKLMNTASVRRLNRLSNNDKIDVVKITDEIYEYRYNEKDVNFSQYVEFDITDVSALHGRTGTGTVWRWTHSDAGSLLYINDITAGVVANQPHHYNADGTVLDGGTNIHIVITDAGSVSTKLTFNLTMSGQPLQADYITFENQAGDTIAVNFDIDANGTIPTGATYIAATIKVEADILSSDSPNQIISKVISALTTPLTGKFDLSLSVGATLDDVNAGDLVSAFGNLIGWNANNKANIAGDGKVAGFPIIVVDSSNRYFDVANPNGIAMSTTSIGTSSSVAIMPTPIIKWDLKHTAGSTKYKIESLNYNDMFRLSVVSGDSPSFIDCGAAVDDIIVIGGDTFKSYNNGEFRILAIDNNSIIYENSAAQEETNTIFNFNDVGVSVSWTSNLDILTGVSGAFANLKVGDWVKKTTDDDTYYRQVISYDSGTGFADTTQITLGSVYTGTSASALGEAYDQKDGVGGGQTLDNVEDIVIYEGDSVRVADALFISSTVNANWFSPSNSGEFEINEIGTDPTDYRPFLRVVNDSGIAEIDRKISVQNSDFYIVEGADSRFTTIKEVFHIAIDDFDNEKRIIYLSPGNRSYKWNQSNGSKIEAMGKVGFDTNIVTGVDGYLYYTGLLRTVQRTIDGFEPDEITYPGMKAVGSLIELLPPLSRKISIVVDVTTKDGINLSEIANEIKSTIINYVNALKVGEDVIMSDIIVRVKTIDGVEAITLVEPEPSTERIFINDDEKALIKASDISVA